MRYGLPCQHYCVLQNKIEPLAQSQICHGHTEKGKLIAKPITCQFMKQELVVLGHVVSKDGTKADWDKIKAVLELPAPQDLTQLRTFLGMVVYVRRFILSCG